MHYFARLPQLGMQQQPQSCGDQF